MARLKSGRPLPRWVPAKLCKQRKAAIAHRAQDAQMVGPMDVKALLRGVRSVAEEGFGSGPISLRSRLREQMSRAGRQRCNADVTGNP
ncbi:hypothetical protein CRT23_13060 [Methylobacterium sp. V23]|nr:hypothetical protein CRT23_13060 [Methylobacterium sp. V23]